MTTDMDSTLTEDQRTMLLLAKELGRVKREVQALKQAQAQVLEEAAWVRTYAADHSAYTELADL